MKLLTCNIPISSRRKKAVRGLTKSPKKPASSIESVPCVMESAPGTRSNQKIERLLSDILARLEHIEEKIDEAVYPPESAIKPAYVKKIHERYAKLAKGNGSTYSSMDDFPGNIRK